MKTLYACAFVLATVLGSVTTPHLEAASWGKVNSKNTAAAKDTTVPNIPESMIPQKNPMNSFGDSSDTSQTSSQSIIEVILADPSFTTLAAAIKSADLISALSAEGPYTVFAPNDAAFAKLSPNALSDLLKPEGKEKLSAILTYHIVPGQFKSDQLKTGKVKSLQGKPLNVQVKGQDILINHAKVVKADIPASNGVIYAVDTVLLP